MTSLQACSFCAKTSKEVQRLICGPLVMICDECVALCVDIIAEDAAKHGMTPTGDGVPLLVKQHRDLDAAHERERHLRAAMARAVAALDEGFGLDRPARCSWCGTISEGQEGARAHAATCSKHPAVVKLQEAIRDLSRSEEA